MVLRQDVETLLQTGSWQSARAKSPGPADTRNRASHMSRHEQVPRTFRRRGFNSHRFPPWPCVEDEAVSLAKEHSHGQGVSDESTDEQPKHRGDVDQTPVILPVHEHNPERRFVLVPNSSEMDSTEGLDTQPPYDGNTCKKFVLVQPDEEASDSQPKAEETRPKEDSPNVSRARCHTDLPSIKTDLRDAHAQSPPYDSETANTRRHRASVSVDQKPPASSEYFDDRRDSEAVEGFLSPVTQHSTTGRDRSYWDYNSGPSSVPLRRSHSGREPKHPRAASDDRRSVHSSKSPAGVSRHSSTVEGLRHEHFSGTSERRITEREERHAYHSERHRGDAPSNRRAVSPPNLSGRESSPPQRGERRRSPSTPYPSASKEALPTRTASHRRRHQQPSGNEDEYSGSEYGNVRRSDHRGTRSPRNTVVGHDDGAGHTGPEHSVDRQKPRGSPPLISPRLAKKGHFSDAPRSAAALTDEPKDVPPFPTSDRASIKNDSLHVEMPMAVSIPMANLVSSGISTSSDRYRFPMATPSQSRQGLTNRESPPPKGHYQPRVLEPEKMKQPVHKPITSYRIYSEDVQQGLLPRLPDCPRVVPRVGYDDWLTMPRAENLNMCPDCYEAVFANSPFKHAFVPAHRSLDKPIGCDFGISPWYRIAYLMTLKYGYTDLRLLQGLSAVAARHQPCAGQRSATRIWHSLLDPQHKRPILTFPVCHGCARTVEVLLPNLAGAFAPLDSPSEPSKGLCALRFAPDRKRFLAYFDLLETASDRALSRKAAPDLQHLANRVRETSLLDECHRARPVPGRKWHVMEALPEFTVCEECFDEVVWPLIEAERGDGGADDAGSQRSGHGAGTGGAIARRFFHRTQPRQMAACQLYSERMREAFRTACRHNDFKYLQDVVQHRILKEERMRARLRVLQQEATDDPRVQEEIARTVRDWKLVE